LATQAITQPQSDVLGLWSSNEMLLRAFQWKRSGGLVTSSCLKAGCFSGSRSTIKKGMPCVSFGYQTEAKAIAGRDHVVAALNGAQEVLCG
jgi:hypothetical protein